MRNLIVASILGLALVTAGVAYAGDDVPAKMPEAKTEAAPATPAEKPATATKSPIHSMMKWVASHMVEEGCGCPSTPEGEKAWRAWFKAENPKLASLRTALMADGWNADRTVGFFKQMAAAKAGGCCDKGNCDKGNCDKGECGKGCCGGCDKAKGAAAATGDAGKTGDAASSGCCGGCDKAKSKGDCGKGCCGGCDKKAKGAAAATGDAGKTGDASDACPCTGKPMKDCGGCENKDCPCGKDKSAGKKAASAK